MVVCLQERGGGWLGLGRRLWVPQLVFLFARRKLRIVFLTMLEIVR